MATPPARVAPSTTSSELFTSITTSRAAIRRRPAACVAGSDEPLGPHWERPEYQCEDGGQPEDHFVAPPIPWHPAGRIRRTGADALTAGVRATRGHRRAPGAAPIDRVEREAEQRHHHDDEHRAERLERSCQPRADAERDEQQRPHAAERA